MSTTEPKFAAVLSYLRAEFPGYAIERLEEHEWETALQLTSPDQVHNVRLQHAFLEETPVEDIEARLHEFRLAATLRDLGDLPIAVSVNGCIFS